MPLENDDRTLPRPGERLPLAETVKEARAALAHAIERLREFQQDKRYPGVTRREADEIIDAIRHADSLAAQLDSPFVMKD